MLRIEPLKDDQAPSAILELVDGPKDIRFAMTARTIARQRERGEEMNEMTKRNMEKVVRYREDGEEEMEHMITRLGKLKVGNRDNSDNQEKRWGGKV